MRVICKIVMICTIFVCVLYFLNHKESFAYSTQTAIKKTCKQPGVLWALSFFESEKMCLGEKLVFNFNKQCDRKKILWFSCLQDHSIANELGREKKIDRLRSGFEVSKRGVQKVNRISKRFFGVNTNVSIIFSGDYPDNIPFLWEFHIIEKKGKRVKAKANYSVTDEAEKRYLYYEIPVVFTLKKNKNGKYGYVIKRISIWKKEEIYTQEE